MSLLVANIPWPGPEADPTDALRRRLGVPVAASLQFELLKRSVDGRRRPPQWLANYRVDLDDPALEQRILNAAPHGVRAYGARDHERFDKEDAAQPQRQRWPAGVRPIIVGAGPAGLFAALRLGEAGAPAILIERGGPVEERHHAVRKFWRHAELDDATPVAFGEGGAGAFSDG